MALFGLLRLNSLCVVGVLLGTGVSSLAFAADVASSDSSSSLELGAVTVVRPETTEFHLRAVGPEVFSLHPSLEVGVFGAEGTDDKGEITSTDALEIALGINERTPITELYFLASSLWLGMTFDVEGRKLSDPATTSRLKSIPYFEVRFGNGLQTPDSHWLAEFGLSFRFNAVGNSAYVVANRAILQSQDLGGYVVLGYRF